MEINFNGQKTTAFLKRIKSLDGGVAEYEVVINLDKSLNSKPLKFYIQRSEIKAVEDIMECNENMQDIIGELILLLGEDRVITES